MQFGDAQAPRIVGRLQLETMVLDLSDFPPGGPSHHDFPTNSVPFSTMTVKSTAVQIRSKACENACHCYCFALNASFVSNGGMFDVLPR